jgi:BolA family transcriptional regulator, general stress-responsive regulator
VPQSPCLSSYKEQLIQAFSPSHIELIDESHHHVGHPGASSGGKHFKLIIAAPFFESKPLLQCHRLIYNALGDAVGTSIHALSIEIRHV